MAKETHSTLVYVLYGAVLLSVLFGRLGVAGNNATFAAQPSESNVNATVAKVIDAMLGADAPKADGAIPIPEHYHDKAQRIVARKGVDNEGTLAGRPPKQGVVANLNISSTSQSAVVVAEDDKPLTAASTRTPEVPAGRKALQISNATSSDTGGSSSTNGGGESTASKSLDQPLANATTKVNISPSTSSVSPSANGTLSIASNSSKPLQSVSPVAVPSSTATAAAEGASTGSNVTVSQTKAAPATKATASTTATTTTTKTSTTTTTTTTTTAKPPTKPKITYSVEDEPKLLQAAKPGYASPYDPIDSSGRLRVDEPLAQFSKEFIPSQRGGLEPPNGRREYVVPIVTLIFAIPLLLGLFLLSYRRAKEFWLTRHYRRMDFLIDGMYNY